MLYHLLVFSIVYSAGPWNLKATITKHSESENEALIQRIKHNRSNDAAAAVHGTCAPAALASSVRTDSADCLPKVVDTYLDHTFHRSVSVVLSCSAIQHPLNPDWAGASFNCSCKFTGGSVVPLVSDCSGRPQHCSIYLHTCKIPVFQATASAPFEHVPFRLQCASLRTNKLLLDIHANACSKDVFDFIPAKTHTVYKKLEKVQRKAVVQNTEVVQKRYRYYMACGTVTTVTSEVHLKRLVEWIFYHRWQGCDHFHVTCHLCDPALTARLRVLQEFGRGGDHGDGSRLLTLVPVRYFFQKDNLP